MHEALFATLLGRTWNPGPDREHVDGRMAVPRVDGCPGDDACTGSNILRVPARKGARMRARRVRALILGCRGSLICHPVFTHAAYSGAAHDV
ncbi:hypothetical protein ACS5PK_08695 [Roseateles sp. DB2]|uniref:hypothetical protein n=1 Tax=Roseateles sp. DB2 TaxID=3453717 RepID=UPI003EECFD2B